MRLTKTFFLLIIPVCITIVLISNASANEGEKFWLDSLQLSQFLQPFLFSFRVKTGQYPDKRSVPHIDGYNVNAFIHNPHGEIRKVTLTDKNEELVLSVRTPTKGIYLVFLTAERVNNKTREFHISKQEFNGDRFFYGKPWAGLDRRTLVIPRLTRDIPFELIRERMKEETTRVYDIGPGYFIIFRAYFQGNPQKGIPVTITTREGWSKTVITDADGRATFQLIRDDYRRKLFRFKMSEVLVEASLITPEEGQIADSHYVRTHYHMTWLIGTSPYLVEIRPRLDGLYLFLLMVVMVGGGSFLYRFLTLKSDGKSGSDEKI